MPIPVHFPFVMGQDESWDKKLLPLGPLRGIRNMFFERTGRLVPRRATETETYANEEDIDDTTLAGLIEPTLSVTEPDTGFGPRTLYARESRVNASGVSEKVLIEKTGAATVWQEAKTYYPPRDAGAGQTLSYSAYNMRGNAVRAYRIENTVSRFNVIGGATLYSEFPQVCFEVCDSDMNVIFSYTTQLTDSALRRYKMVHSTMSNRAIIFLDNLSTHYWISIQTVAPFTVTTGKFTGYGPSTVYTGWDISAVEGEDAWLFGGVLTSSSDTAWLLKTKFTGGATEQLTSFTPTNALKEWIPGFSVCGVEGDYYIFAGECLAAETDHYMNIRRVQGGVSQNLSGILSSWTTRLDETSWSAPGVAAEQTSEGTVVHFGLALTQLNELGSRGSSLFATIRSGATASIILGDYDDISVDSLEVAGERVISSPLPLGGVGFFLSIPEHWAPDNDTSREFELGGVCHIIAPNGYRGGVQLTSGARRITHRLPAPDTFGIRTLWPLYLRLGNQSLESDDGRYSVAWYEQSTATVTGLVTRNGETLLPGCPLTAYDGRNVFPAGYDTGPMVIYATTDIADITGNLTAESTYFYQFIAEWRDTNGRTWTSSPSVPRSIDLDATHTAFEAKVQLGFVTPSTGARVIAYLTKGDGSVLRHSQEAAMGAGSTHIFRFNDDPAPTAPSPYTQGGNVPNEPPPDCSMIARSRSRIWAAGLPGRPSSIQASQVIVDTQGVYWTNLDNYFVTLPGEVTGLAAIDDSIVAFTERGIYIVQGEGPNGQGLGSFLEPQAIPSTVGCINHKSIVVHEQGVFFQSQRGLESISRGGGSAEWLGQPVVDVLQAYPVCLGSVACRDDSTIRWLFQDRTARTTVVVVYDVHLFAWYVYEYGTSAKFISGGPEMRLGGSTLLSVRAELNTGEDPASPGGLIATQSLRVAGLNGWAYGKRMNILGEYLGPCRVKLEFDFDDKPHLSRDTYTWTLTSADYTAGDPVQLELDLPIYNYSSIRFRLYVLAPLAQPGDPLTTATTLKTFAANGITVYFDPAEGGPRLASYQKG